MSHISEDIMMDFVDGNLLPEQKKAAELHLLECSACKEEIALYRSLSNLLVEENILKAPPAMANHVMTQVELHHSIILRKVKSRNLVIRFGGIMFGLLAAIIGLGLILGPPVGDSAGFQIPQYIVNAVNYLQSLKIPIKNPSVLYGVCAFMIILVVERVVNSFRHRKVTA